MRWINPVAALALLLLAGAARQTVPPPQMPAIPAPPPPTVQPRFVVVLDAAHGGTDTGARFRDGAIEKNITLGLSVRLRSELQARGIQVVTTRETDTNIPQATRAATANHAQAAACVVIHATATGSGVHLFTSSLAPAARAEFLPWPTAQSVFVTQSLRLESEIDAALAHAAIPVTLGRAAVEPLDHLTCPAVAVEVAPLVAGHVTAARSVTDPAYQKSVIDALAAAIVAWRSDWKQS